MKRLFFISLISLYFTSGVASADYQNPVTSADCFLRGDANPEYQQRIDALSNRWSACWNKKWSIRERSGDDYLSCSAGSKGYPAACSQYNKQKCSIRAKYLTLEAACRAKLAQNRLRENEVKQAQKEFERAQRERSLAAQEQAQATHRQQMAQGNRVMLRATLSAMDGVSPDQAGAHVTDLHKIPKDLRNLANGDIKSVLLRRAGLSNYNMAYQAVVHERLPTPNAHSVSGQLVKFGTRFVVGANAAAEQDLRDALAKFDGSFGNSDGSTYSSPYSSTNPRPFATQIDDAIEMSQELEAHIDRVADSVLRLPMGDQSVVNTSTGNLLSEIVKARASGDISSLSNALTEYVGSVRDQVIAEYQSEAPETISEAKMREERLAVLARVERQALKLAAEQQKNQPKKGDKGQPKRKNAMQCARLVDHYAPAHGSTGSRIRNNCNYSISCQVEWNGIRQWDPAIRPHGLGRPYAVRVRLIRCK